VDRFTPALQKWHGLQSQKFLRKSNLDLATLFGPGIFKGGKFAQKFLKNVKKVLPGIGVGKFAIKPVTRGFKNNKARDLFNKSVKKIRNNFDHLQDGDLSGAIKDIHGFPSNGDHLKEVTNALNGLKKARKTLQNLIDNNSLGDEALQSAQDAIFQADNAISKVTEILRKATRSAKNYLND